MKHAFLRRLGALALALAMAASLCVTSAWAAPAVVYPSLDTQLIILKDTNGSYTLTVNDVEDGDKIFWSTAGAGNATVSTGETTVKNDPSGTGLIGDSITVGASRLTTTKEKADPGTVKVRVERGGKPHGNELTCYVYCGVAPITAPPSLPALDVGKTYDLEITADYFGEYFNADDITFSSSSSSVTVDEHPRITDYADGKKKLTVTLRGVSEGKPRITMDMKWGYTQYWDLPIMKSDTILVDTVAFSNVPSTIRLTAGETYQMPQPIISPSNATSKKILWTIDPIGSSVASVDENGKITAKAPGNVKVIATAEKGTANAKAEFTVQVTDSPISIKLGPADDLPSVIDMRNGGSKALKLAVTATGLNSTKVKVTRWTANNPGVAFLNNPSATSARVNITGKTGGTASFTAYVTYPDANNITRSMTLSCTITVLDDKSVEITRVDLSETSHTMPADGKFKLTATVYPTNVPTSAKIVKWTSSNDTVAEVNEDTGEVEGKGAGEAVITAKPIYGNLTSSCTVKITPKAEAIRLTGGFDYNVQGTNHYEHTFANLKDELKVKAVFTPSAAADPVRWAIKKDADTSVATVSSGTTTQATITAVSPGETTITAIPLDPAGKERVLSAGPAEVKVTVSGLTIQQTVDGTTSTITSLNLAEGRRQIVTFKAFGNADTGGTSCDWSISDPSIVMIGSKTGGSTTLTARRPGTVTLTARRGSYSATCTVTVGEDSAVTITASTAPGSPLQFSKLASQLQSACSSKTGSSLSYITNLTVASTDQGILHDQHHSSADTGGGVGAQDQYYPGTAPQGKRSMNDLSFVPRNTFSGTAEITYTGWSTNNKSFNGTIRVTVNGTGDVMYSSNESAPVTFLADDFNLYHPNFSAVSFTPPLDSVGTLYYNYTSPAQPGTKVSSGTTYSRTGNPSLDRVTFVPAAGYSGTVRISYKGTDTGGRSFTGVVTITVNSAGSAGSTTDLYYPMKEDSWVTFRAADFNSASQNTLGESLAYVRFALPPSNEGTLFYNYRGFGNYDSAVANTTSYYYSGTPALSGVSFVPTTTTPGQVDVDYTGYTVKGNTFTGTIHLGRDVTGPGQNNGMRYTVFTGKSVSFSTNNFNTACIAATGASLDYVQFTQTPAVGQGTLRYTRGSSSGNYSLSTSTRCYRSAPNSWDVQLSNVYFQANANYTGTVTLPFVGYNTNGTSFTGEVTIEVTPPTATDITFTGTTASPYRLSANVVRSACSGALDGTLSYITFTSLPSATAGRLYLNYNGFRTGSQVNTGTRYYASSSPSIDQLSFVPRGRYNGQVTISFTATNTSGQSVNGQIVLNLSSTGGSGHFSDLGDHAWAAPAVDYLYENGVTNGTTPSTFGPNQRILRCDFVLMLCRAFGFGEVEGYSFADVPTNAYYAGAVAAAKQRGIINGDGDRFMPNSELTRQDAMVMIYNAMKAAGWGVSPSSTSILGRFPDGSSVASYARDAVSTLVQMGAVNGDNGMLYPYNPITRAEAAVILHFVMTM